MKGLSARSFALLAAAGLSTLLVFPASAAPASQGFHWSDWWLPEMHSEHGVAIDQLFCWIFAITVVALVLVQVTLVVFLVKYRHRPGKGKAHFIHGNTRLEMIWTLTPAVILGILALASKQVWGAYRYNAEKDEDRAQIMVIGEQFNWNVIYPGPDGHIGKYLDYPKLSDPKYRKYSRKAALGKIQEEMSTSGNPLGQVIDKDPNYLNADGTNYGEDDDWVPNAGTRPIIVPVDKTVEVLLSAKDVLHDFFLPNFRVKLDAVPGMIGHIYFKPLKQSTENVAVEKVGPTDHIWIDCDTPGAVGPPKTDDGTPQQGEYTIVDPGNPEMLRRIVADEIGKIVAADKEIPDDQADQRRMPKLKAALGDDVQAGMLKLLDAPELAAARAKGLKPLLDAQTKRLADDTKLQTATVPDLVLAVSMRVPVLNRYGNLADLARQRHPGLAENQVAQELAVLAKDLRAHGIGELTVAHPFELVCEELCGMGHGTMRGELVVLSQDQYDNFIYKNLPKPLRKGKQLRPYKSPASTQPAPHNIAQATVR